MKVVLRSEARGDLEQIAEHIALDSPARALSFVAELVAAAHELGDMPRAFPLVPRHAHLQVRRRIHGQYLVFFRVDSDRWSSSTSCMARETTKCCSLLKPEVGRPPVREPRRS